MAPSNCLTFTFNSNDLRSCTKDFFDVTHVYRSCCLHVILKLGEADRQAGGRAGGSMMLWQERILPNLTDSFIMLLIVFGYLEQAPSWCV